VSSSTSTPQSNASMAAMSVSAFVGIASIGAVERLGVAGLDPVFLVGSLGASAVIVFGAPDSPTARPVAVLGGHLLSALIGVACFRLAGSTPWFSGALAVALSIAVMHRTGTLHPPGGATALIANIGPERVKALGFLYALAPVLSGAAILVAVALVTRHGQAWALGLVARVARSRPRAEESPALDG
jgi:CBS domain-containing membrane protein